MDRVQGWLVVEGNSGAHCAVRPQGENGAEALRQPGPLRGGPFSVLEVFVSRVGAPLVVFAASRHIINLAKLAGVRTAKRAPHTLRHYFALGFIHASGDAFSLPRILAHNTLDKVRRYVHLAAGDTPAADAPPADRLL